MPYKYNALTKKLDYYKTDQVVVAHIDGGDAASTYGFAITDGSDAAVSTVTVKFDGGDATTF